MDHNLTSTISFINSINRFSIVRPLIAIRPTHYLFALVILFSPMLYADDAKSIVPDINAEGNRGEIARKMQASSARKFLRADINRDNLISAQEAAEELFFISKNFARYDKNKDNSLSWQEFLGHDKWPAPVHEK